MSTKRNEKGRRRAPRRRGFSVEGLEGRTLLTTTETFVAPPVMTKLITEAEHGKNTSQQQINVMLEALQSQMTSGPLADFTSGTVDADGFIVEAQGLEASFELSVGSQLATMFPNIAQLLAFQGQRMVANLEATNQEESVGLIPSTSLESSFQTTIDSLTAGPIFAIGTKTSTITNVTKTFITELDTLTTALGNSSLTLQQVTTTLGAEAEAFRTDIHAGIQMTQLRISGETDTDIDALEQSAINIEQTAPSNAASQLSSAVSTFNDAVLDKNGLLAPGGALSKSRPAKLKPSGTNGQAISEFPSVSGTTTTTGTATLTATLTSSDGSPLMGESVGFTVNGAFAGVAVTNFTGVATLAGVPESGALGTSTGAVVAYFASDTNFLATTGTGNLVVNQAPSSVLNVSGSAVYGAPATLQATLTTASGQAIPNETISFSLDGTTVGTAVTNSSGVATLTGPVSTDSVGTDTGGIVATFAGDSTYAASAGTGNFVVSLAGTTLSNVSGTAAFGGTATLTATLNSTATNSGVAGQTVNFLLDGTSVGSAVTNSSGVATLEGVTTGQTIGTDAGGVVATFGGSTNYAGAPNASGNLVIGQAVTSLSSVGGTASFGGTATLTATLISTSTDQGLSGQTVTFTLDNRAVGTAVTDSSGVATLTGVATTDAAGSYTDDVVATFAGNADYSDSTTAGNLVVSQAATSFNGVAGTSSFGGPATLTATLTSTVTNQPIPNESVSFTLSGTSVGSATTNSSGVATLTGVTASDAVGTIPSAVVATFSGDTNYAAATNGSGDLVISKANTSLGSVGGTASYGGSATLVATLTSAATNKGVADEDVTFELNGTQVGSALTNASGVATDTGVATSAGVGTQAGVVTALFAGDTDYNAATNATGDLVVSKAATAITSVGGTATYGGTATLTATLKSSVTGLAIPDETLSFMLNGVPVGTLTTNAQGVANLTGVTTSAGAGTEAGAVVVSFAGDANYAAATNGTGDFVVSKAATTLTSVSGTAPVGGPATLMATLMSAETNQPIADEPVAFTLDQADAGSTNTLDTGVATVTGVPTSDPEGTDPNAVGAAFAGDSNYQASTGEGDLTVS